MSQPVRSEIFDTDSVALSADDLLVALLFDLPIPHSPEQHAALPQIRTLPSQAAVGFELEATQFQQSLSPEMAQLQNLLLERERQRIALLEAQIIALQNQLHRQDSLVEVLSPVISSALARCVRESRDQVAEALYPVIGKTVVRAVGEAIRDLARRIDANMRQSLSPSFWYRFQARRRGLDPAETSLRGVLPFEVHEIFLIHRTSGLLICHHSRSDTLRDPDLISGMLTAIRSYVQDSFQPVEEGSLDAISYGDLRILVEDGSNLVVAVVLQGIEPAGFQHVMREQLSTLQAILSDEMQTYQGDPIDQRRILPLLDLLLQGEQQ